MSDTFITDPVGPGEPSLVARLRASPDALCQEAQQKIVGLTHHRDLLNQTIADLRELLREIRDHEVDASDEADKFLRDHQPSELSKVRAALGAAQAECKRLREDKTDMAEALVKIAFYEQSMRNLRERAKTALEKATEGTP